MAMAAALISGVLVPTLSVVRDAMAKSRELNRRNLLANYAVRTLEGQVALTATNWASANVTGNYSADGHSSIKYSVTKSDAVASGGIVGQLMHIQVTVYDDIDGDNAADAEELKVAYRTKLAKLLSYENEE
jgi:hypothetical protein